MELAKIITKEDNPRFITDEKLESLKRSIKSFEKMMELRPMVIDENNILLGGNMRHRALTELGYKDVPPSWIKQVKGLTDDEKKEFIIKDNVGFGEWDWDILNNDWETVSLLDWGLDVVSFVDTPKEVRDLSPHLNVEYKIMITVDSESDQEELYDELIKRQYRCQISTL